MPLEHRVIKDPNDHYKSTICSCRSNIHMIERKKKENIFIQKLKFFSQDLRVITR